MENTAAVNYAATNNATPFTWELVGGALQAAFDSHQSQLNLILEAVKSNPSIVSSSSVPAPESQVVREKISLPAKEMSSSPACPAFQGPRVSWGCSKPKRLSKHTLVQKGNGCLLPSSAGAVMKDVQSCGKS